MVLESDDRQLCLSIADQRSPALAARAGRQGFALPPRGFTLLEMLVVLVIVGLLTSYVAPRFFSQIGRSEIKVAKAQIDAFGKALDQYRLDVGRYPTTEQGLGVLIKAPDKSTRWQGPYLQKALPKDPWGNNYAYFSPGKDSEYVIISYGRDGKPGGQGDDADIASQ